MIPNEEISLQRKYGLRLLQVLIVLVAFFLVRDCILTLNSDLPSETLLNQYYKKGYEAGKIQAHGRYPVAEPTFAAPLMQTRYRAGFRNGWDDGRNNK